MNPGADFYHLDLFRYFRLFFFSVFGFAIKNHLPSGLFMVVDYLFHAGLPPAAFGGAGFAGAVSAVPAALE